MADSTNSGLAAFFDALVLLTRLSGGKMRGGEKVDATGFTGAINFVFTGEGGASWYCDVSPHRARFFRGTHPQAKATVTIGVNDFFKLLCGQTSYMSAQLTGRVRVVGEGHAGMILGAIVTQVHTMRKAGSWIGFVSRRWTDRVLRKSATGLRFST